MPPRRESKALSKFLHRLFPSFRARYYPNFDIGSSSHERKELSIF